jgi:hypothetical protein
LSIAALMSALKARSNPPNALVHSDRGGICGDDEYVKMASGHRLWRSMSRTSNPWDNAVIDSLFSTLTHELLDQEGYGSPDGAQRSIAEWIGDLYNVQRRHTSIGNRSPIKYELACQICKRRTISTCLRTSGKPSRGCASAQGKSWPKVPGSPRQRGCPHGFPEKQ